MPKTLTIKAQFDSTALVRRLRHGEKRLAYAAVNAINRVAKRAQKEIRTHVESVFVIRKREFVLREAAKISPFASVKQARAFAEIAVGQKPRLLLSLFERGAKREPVTPGATFVAEPVVGGPARPDFGAPVPPEFRMSRLRFDKTQTGKVRVAAKRTQTYLIPGVGIFQRLSGEASRAVYIFTRGKKLDPVLRFVVTVKRVAEKWLREEFEREVVKAIAHSRGEGI